MLGYGVTDGSLRALEAALGSAIALRHDASVVECVAALYARGRIEAAKGLTRYAESLDTEALGWLAGLALLRQVPADIWPDSLVVRMQQGAGARFVAARILLGRGNKVGEEIILEALKGSTTDRHMAIVALAHVASERADELLRSALATEKDMALQLAICASLGRRCSLPERLRVLNEASADESPVTRYQAAMQLGLLPNRTREQLVREWLTWEPDRVIRWILRS